jgi:hypothetical protein
MNRRNPLSVRHLKSRVSHPRPRTTSVPQLYALGHQAYQAIIDLAARLEHGATKERFREHAVPIEPSQRFQQDHQKELQEDTGLSDFICKSLELVLRPTNRGMLTSLNPTQVYKDSNMITFARRHQGQWYPQQRNHKTA